MMFILSALMAVGIVIWCGIPLSYFTKRKRELGSFVIESFLFGILTIGNLLPIIYYFGLPVKVGMILILVTVSIFNLYILLQKKMHLLVDRKSVVILCSFFCCLMVYISVYLFTKGAPFYGRAWGDMLNYSSSANYLIHYKKGDTVEYTKPASKALRDGGLLNDRQGQNFLHAFVSSATKIPVLESFYLASILGALATYAAVFFCCLFLRLPIGFSSLIALYCGTAPPISAVLLESFLSQVLACPFVLFGLYIATKALKTGERVFLGINCLCTSWIYLTYFEILPIFFGSLFILFLFFNGLRYKAILSVLLSSLVGVLIPNLFAYNYFILLQRISGVDGFDKFFPYAYSWEGFARLFVGDAVKIMPFAGVKVLGMACLLCIFVCIIGFLMRFIKTRNPLAITLPAIFLGILIIPILPGHHSYQFYKLIQSFWPIVIIGNGIAISDSRKNIKKQINKILLLGLIIVLAFSVSCSLFMLGMECFAGSERSGMNLYLQKHGYSDVKRMLSGHENAFIVINTPDRSHWNEIISNGILCLQLEEQNYKIQSKLVSIGDREHQQPHNPNIPEDPETYLSTRSIQKEFLTRSENMRVIQNGAVFLRPSEKLFNTLATEGRLALFKPKSDKWLIACSVFPPFPQGFLSDDEFVIVGNSPEQYLRIDFESEEAVPSGIDIQIRWEPINETFCPVWHIYSNMGYGNTFINKEKIVSICSGPLRQGVTQIFFGPRIVSNNLKETDPTKVKIKILEIVYGP